MGTCLSSSHDREKAMKVFEIGRRWLPIVVLLTGVAPVAFSQNAHLSGE